jgi:hypothetical protein
MPSAAFQLMTDIDTLACPDRMRLLAGRARALAGSAELMGLLAELYRGDPFQRRLAVFMATVARHRPTLEAAREDPDPSVGRAAVTGWFRAGPVSAAELAALVTEGSWHTRRQVYRLLRRLPRPGLADGLIEVVWKRFGDVEAARLLPACSADTVARLLPELGYALGGWSLLTCRYPQVVLDVAGQQLAGLTPAGLESWWATAGDGVMTAAGTDPHRVLDLLERYGPGHRLPGPLRWYTELAAADTGRVVALLCTPDRAKWLARAKLPRSLRRRLAELGPAAAPVARRLREHEPSLTALLSAAPPSRRSALYDAAYAGVDRGQARPSDPLLEVLPRPRRHAEARRILALGLVGADEALTLHYTAFLPFDQARQTLTGAARRARAEDRAAGYALLVGCASRGGDPAVVTETIEYLRRLRNEQDPVRAQSLTALTRVTPGLIEPAAVDALAQIAADVLAARDASTQTRQALAALAVLVLRHHVGSPPLLAWALRTLDELFSGRLPRLGRIDTQLRRGQETEVFAAVADWLEAGMRRGSYESLFAVAAALHRRAWRLPGLQDMLRRSIDSGNVSGVMAQGIRLWLADPATRAQRVEHVLLTDTSSVTKHEVWAVLCRQRTDLLDLVLTGSPPRGKFLAAGVRWVPSHAHHVPSWLPRQQADYVRLLSLVAADAGAKIYQRTGAIIDAAQATSGGGWALARRYTDASNVNLAEAALAALGRAGRPAEALPVLLGHAGDDRARVAMYVAGQAARFIPPGRVPPLLAADPLADGKVTSRKEALRLAAALSVPGAGDILRRAWEEPGQHRDIRAAIVSAARQRLHDPASWPLLAQAAAGSPQEALAIVAMAIPMNCAPRHRLRYGALVAQAGRHPSEPTARVAWTALTSWVPWVPEAGPMAVAQLTDLDDRTLWRLAPSVLTALLRSGGAGTALRQAVGDLADLDQGEAGRYGPGDPGDPGRDRPARQRLARVADATASWARLAEPDADRAPVLDAARHLAARPGFTPYAVQMMLATARFGDTGPAAQQHLAETIEEACGLLADQQVTAGRLATQLAGRAARDERADPGALYAAATQLGRGGGLAQGLFAVALAGHGSRLGWPPEWRALVHELRRHAQSDVRTVALDVILAEE